MKNRPQTRLARGGFALLFLGLLWILPPALVACDCARPTIQVSRKRGAIIFVGRALEVQPYLLKSSNAGRVVWQVFESWNRDTPRQLVTEGNGLCSFSAERGRVYVVFATRRPVTGELSLSMCSNSVSLECAARTLKVLGRPRTRWEALPRAELVASRIMPCNCMEKTSSRRKERRHSDAVFLGRAIDIQTDESADVSSVTWEVIEAWTAPIPAHVTVLVAGRKSTQCEGFTGAVDDFPWPGRIAPGRVLLIFARKLDTGELYVPSCTNSKAFACYGDIPPEIGQPVVKYQPRPTPGSNESPLDCAMECVRYNGPLLGLQLCAHELPRGSFLKDVSFVEWTDGTVHDLQFSLDCVDYAADRCTPELAQRMRDLISSSKFEPATIAGRAVAVKFSQKQFHPYPP